MLELRISLRHQSVLEVACSMLFVKHIEGSMSAPELALNEVTEGKLQDAYEQHEREEAVEVSSGSPLPFGSIYALNFHRDDLPFTYASVDQYARRILEVATRSRSDAQRTISIVATAVHGPGAGLDTSEAMETLLTAFASELHSMQRLGDLQEIILVERDARVFARLGERLKHLEANGIITFDGDAILLRPLDLEPTGSLEASALRQRSLRHLFVAMPYAKEFDNLYYFGIKDQVERRDLRCERVDKDEYVGDVVERIKERISKAELVIADITGGSPNVFFEVGYAEGVGKPVILLTQPQDVPFDLRTKNQIRYDPHDLLSVSRELGEILDALLTNPPSPEAPARRSAPARRPRRPR